MGPDQVIPIQPSLESIQDSSAVLHRCWKPISYFRKMFPITSVGIEANARAMGEVGRGQFNRPESMDQKTWDGLSTGMQRIMSAPGGGSDSGVSDRYYGIAELEEYYVEDYTRNESINNVVMKDPFIPEEACNWRYIVKPGERLYPRKRLIIFGGGKLLYDGPSPYWHGMYPFAALWTNKVTWSWYGLSLYRDLLPMQDSLNKIPAGVEDMIAKALNPPLLTKQGTVAPAAFQAFNSDLPGARLILNGNVSDIKAAFHWQEPPKLPDYVTTLLQNVLGPEFDRLAGNIDVMAMSSKNQVPGGDTMDTMTSNLQTSLRLEERAMETFLNEAGQQAVSNIIQFYDTKQRMRLLGEDGVTDQDFLYDPGTIYPGSPEFGALYHKNFAFAVKAGTLHSGESDARKAEAIGMASRKLISRKEMFRMMGVDAGRANRILEELVEEQQVEMMLMGGGMAPGQGAPGETRMPRPPEARDGTPV